MAKIVALLLIFAVVQCFNAEIVFRQPSPTWHQQNLLDSDIGGVHYSQSAAKYVGAAMPPDNGGNFGDLVHKRRVSNDKLVLRYIIINEDIYRTETEFEYNNRIQGQNITTVRAVNLGRQRAYVKTVTSSDQGLVNVVGLIRANEQIRLLIEAYAL